MTAIIATFDGTDELPPAEEFDRARERYWVLAFRNEDTRRGWLMSPGRPVDVPNGSMVWRRPTYREFLAWKAWWAEHGNPDPDGHLAQYRRGVHDIPLCECGHGIDTHRRPYYTAETCRMSCLCTRIPAKNGSDRP